jgi:hypothetical protein
VVEGVSRNGLSFRLSFHRDTTPHRWLSTAELTDFKVRLPSLYAAIDQLKSVLKTRLRYVLV